MKASLDKLMCCRSKMFHEMKSLPKRQKLTRNGEELAIIKSGSCLTGLDASGKTCKEPVEE